MIEGHPTAAFEKRGAKQNVTMVKYLISLRSTQFQTFIFKDLFLPQLSWESISWIPGKKPTWDQIFSVPQLPGRIC